MSIFLSFHLLFRILTCCLAPDIPSNPLLMATLCWIGSLPFLSACLGEHYVGGPGTLVHGQNVVLSARYHKSVLHLWGPRRSSAPPTSSPLRPVQCTVASARCQAVWGLTVIHKLVYADSFLPQVTAVTQYTCQRHERADSLLAGQYA
jgi:hypothetical protein